MTSDFAKLRRAVEDLAELIPVPSDIEIANVCRKATPPNETPEKIADAIREAQKDAKAQSRADRAALLRRAIALARLYREQCGPDEPGGDTRDRKRRIGRAASYASKLSSLLREMGSDVDHLRAAAPEPESFATQLELLAKEAKAAACMPAPQSPECAFEFCIRELADAYREATGCAPAVTWTNARNEPPPFFILVREWCACAGISATDDSDDDKTNAALAKRIQRALKPA